MSHFTRIQTSISDLATLQSVLTQLEVSWEKVNTPLRGYLNETHRAELVIHQPNSIDIGFAFNGKEYELIADLSFWQQPWSMNLFLDKVNQMYASELLNNELTNLGFATVSYVKTENGTIDLIADKWVN
jgi:hypothetical protein|tara:strand:- start:812 stop:1198 length:387 start_codon:yes stop_codon:yes gene_type:complete